MNTETSNTELLEVCFLLQDTGYIYGAQRATLDLIAGLQASGACNVHVILFQEVRIRRPVRDFEWALRDLGVPCLKPPVALAYSGALVRSIRDYMMVNGIRVLHSIGYKADFHAWRACQGGRRFHVVSTVHGWYFLPDWKERMYYKLNLWTLERMARVIVLSRYYVHLLQEKGMEVSRIPSGFRPMDPMLEEELDDPDLKYDAGVICRFTGEKNIPMFVRAAKRLLDAHPGRRFVIAGDGPDREAIAEALHAAGIVDEVAMPGFMARETFFAQVRVPVTCSNIENLPYTVMEAMSAGLPVVATRAGGLPDLVEDGVNGFLVDLDDDAALAERIGDLLDDPAKAEAFGAAGREMLARDFSPEEAVQQHLELYRSLDD